MRCDNCIAAQTTGGEYPESYCAAYVPEEKMYEFDNGQWGCLFPTRAIKARIKIAEEAEAAQYRFVTEWAKECEYRERKGINVSDEKEPFIAEAMHCVGLDRAKAYTRNGKKYYRPFRNRFCIPSGDTIWSILRDIGYAEEYSEKHFKLTDAGLNWLGNCLQVTIYPERS